MSKPDARELSDALDLEYWAEREGLSFHVTRGHSGPQMNFKVCPECGDRRSRVYLNQETGWGNCFVCNATFNKLSFIHKTLGYSLWRDTFAQVREALADQGWRPKRTVGVSVEHEKARLPESFELPTPAGENLLYLEQRGITADIARYFHLRYCVAGDWQFANEDGTRGRTAFDERVIIPVFDLDGEFVTFQGRDITGKREPKYLFPKGLPGTGRFLLNGQNALGRKRVVIGEGAFDVMALKIALDEDVELRGVEPIGSFGKHLSYGAMDGNDQLGRLLKLKSGGLEEVTIMWDGEPAALLAAIDAAEGIRRLGLRVRIALLPAGKDPNEVSGQVVRDAFYQASAVTPSLIAQWRLRNPFGRVHK